MRNVINRLEMTWLFQRPDDFVPPRRIATILGWLMTVLTPVVLGLALWSDSRADSRELAITRCEQRIESREGSRARAFTNIDYVSEIVDAIDAFVGIPDDLRAELDRREQQERDLVDEQLPPITVANCDDLINPPEEP